MHGMCRPHTEHQHREAPGREAREASGQVAVAERRPDERLTDADRTQAADLLGEAFRDGVIGVEEFDQRLTAALNARLAADLAGVTDDLPAHWVAEREAQERSRRRAAAHRRGWSAAVRTYAGVMALLLAIWLLTNLDDFGGAGNAYFWPIWPALGWGIPLFLSRPRRAAGRADEQLRTARQI